MNKRLIAAAALAVIATAGGGGFFGISKPTCIRRPFNTVAQDKRNARKRRNVARHKRAVNRT